jgi:predicted nucleic acid-binding protein
MAELRTGAALADDEKRLELSHWIDNTVAPWMGERCLPITIDVLLSWLTLARRLRVKGMAREAPDLLIAATARVHGLIVVTRNVRDFANAGVIVYDPWHNKTHQMDLP